MSAFIRFAGVTPRDVILDIGCGDGRVLVTTAKVLGCRGTGIDISEACIASATEIGRQEGVSQLLTWHCADATRADALETLQSGSPTLVFLYAYPTLLTQLKDLLSSLRRRGARIFTLQYHMSGEGWEPSRVLDEPSMRLYPSLHAPGLAVGAQGS